MPKKHGIQPGSQYAPADIMDDVSGSHMTEDQAEGRKPAEVHGRWTGLYVQRGTGWHLVAAFTCRKEAYLYWNTLADGRTYRLQAMRGTLTTVTLIR